MKIIVAGVATLMLAGAAMAQTMTPADPSTTTPTPPGTMSSTPSNTEVATLTERDGKWWNGDREATPQEIEAHKKAKKYSKPK